MRNNGSPPPIDGLVEPHFDFNSEEIFDSLLAGDMRPPERYGDSRQSFAAWHGARQIVMAEAVVGALASNAAAVINLPDMIESTLAPTKGGKGHRLVLNVPGHLVEQQKLDPADRDLVILVTIPSEALKRARSPIIQPGVQG